ncbi:MAG: DUF3099 domain-containing protein [Microbacterium sp.]|nr:DUF3099 domain-containing protein [Microbacterium sp.]
MAHSITTLPESASTDRHRRMVRYIVAQAIRLACFIGALFASGWWQFILVIAAVLLPYIAVVLANASSRLPGAPVETPGRRELDAGRDPSGADRPE